MLIFPTVLTPLKLPTVNYYYTSQPMQPNQSPSQYSSKKSKTASSNKEPDVRQVVGGNFELEVFQLLKSHNLLPDNICTKKTHFPFGNYFLQDVQIFSKTQYFDDIIDIKTFCDAFKQSKNSNNAVEVEFDIEPHFRPDLTYEQVKQKYLAPKQDSRLLFYENIFGVNIQPQNALYAGQIKSNFFNPTQIINSDSDILKKLKNEEKTALYRTGQLVRKVCLLRKYELMQKKVILDDNFHRCSRINKFPCNNTTIEELSKSLTNMKEIPICFFIVTRQIKNKQEFLKKLGEKNQIFFKRFSKNFQVIFNLVIIVQKQKGQPKIIEIKNLEQQKFKNELQQFKSQINNKLVDMDSKFEQKFKEMDNKLATMDSKFEQKFKEMDKKLVAMETNFVTKFKEIMDKLNQMNTQKKQN